MKTIIKKFLQKYTNPIWDGQSADELAEMLEAELNKKPKLSCKLGGIDDSIAEAMGFKTKKIRPFNPEIIDEEMERVQDEEFRYGEEREREEFEVNL